MHVDNGAFINFAFRNMAKQNQAAEPLRSIRINFVVIGAAHLAASTRFSAATIFSAMSREAQKASSCRVLVRS